MKIAGTLLAALCIAAVALVTSSTAKTAHRTSSVAAQVALDWNTNAVTTIRAATTTVDGPTPRPLYQTEGLIYLSYVQAAVYDADVAIEGRYQPYGFSLFAPPGASAAAAVAAAAHDVLAYHFPAQQTTLDSLYATSLAGIPDGQAKTDGIAVGRAAALGVIAIRSNDGRNAATAVFGTPGPVVPGQWQVVPPATTAQTPWVAFMHPFLLRSASQFRPGEPPALGSSTYKRDIAETRAFGAKASTAHTTLMRTQAQTETAYFWNRNVIDQFNQALRDLATQRNLDLSDTTRLLAMGDLVVTDAAIACFDAKYTYLAWRPYTAIVSTTDPDWLPLVNTPNHPEYPAAHGCATGALSQVMATALGTDHINADVWGGQAAPSTLTVKRHFETVSDMQSQIVDARVWIGFHLRSSGITGVGIGKRVAGWALKHYFNPISRSERDRD
ncbi:MAG: hypothetical protein QOK36_4143 [Gaiellales bacterium]|jgi:hypothetical protein|nr:hypothetical protein [Gaiellales bacterium]